MDLPALIVNLGILVATAGAAAVAWWQAIEAGRRKDGAKAAESRAIKAQQQSAAALVEANAIADEVRTLAKENLALQKTQDYRLQEYRDVQWSGGWDSDVSSTTRATFELTNTGTTDALAVVLVLRVADARHKHDLGTIRAGQSAKAELANSEMMGPVAAEVLSRQALELTIHWVSPAGYAEQRHNQLPHGYLSTSEN